MTLTRSLEPTNRHLGLYWEFLDDGIIWEHITGFRFNAAGSLSVDPVHSTLSIDSFEQLIVKIYHKALEQGIHFSDDQLSLLARSLNHIAYGDSRQETRH